MSTLALFDAHAGEHPAVRLSRLLTAAKAHAGVTDQVIATRVHLSRSTVCRARKIGEVPAWTTVVAYVRFCYDLPADPSRKDGLGAEHRFWFQAWSEAKASQQRRARGARGSTSQDRRLAEVQRRLEKWERKNPALVLAQRGSPHLELVHLVPDVRGITSVDGLTADLKRVKELAAYSFDEIAERSGLKRTTVYELTKPGRRRLDPTKVLDFLTACGVTDSKVLELWESVVAAVNPLPVETKALEEVETLQAGA